MVLKLINLSKKYAHTKKYALKDITLSIDDGQLIGITGRNGAGKTTLIGLLNGTLKATSGYFSFRDYNNLQDNPSLCRNLFATMGQVYAPLRGVTPYEAIKAICYTRGLSSKTIKSKIEYLGENLKVTDYMKESSDKLSGGIKRIVALCMALAQGADVTLLDEPTNDVDPIRRRLVWELLKDYTVQGRTILVSSHNLDEVSAYSDELVVLKEGQIVHSGKDFNLKNQLNNVQIQIEVSPGEDFVIENYQPVSQEGHVFKYEVSRDSVRDFLDTVYENVMKSTIVSYNLRTTPSFSQFYSIINQESDNLRR